MVLNNPSPALAPPTRPLRESSLVSFTVLLTATQHLHFLGLPCPSLCSSWCLTPHRQGRSWMHKGMVLQPDGPWEKAHFPALWAAPESESARDPSRGYKEAPCSVRDHDTHSPLLGPARRSELHHLSRSLPVSIPPPGEAHWGLPMGGREQHRQQEPAEGGRGRGCVHAASTHTGRSRAP